MKRKDKHQKSLKEFVFIVRDILRSEEFRQMKTYRHHVRGTLYDHSVKVAYLCYQHHKRFGLKNDLSDLVRGALLHDYYLYDLHDGSHSHRFHWFRHPRCALQKALARYPSLTDAQQDMIKHHMFPLTVVPPTTKGGWLVCFYDKIAAISDRFGNPREKVSIRFQKDKKYRFLTFHKHFYNKTQKAQGYNISVT